jgi:hypothetical protein
VRARAVRDDHPILWGYDEEFPAFDRFGPYLSVSADRESDVILRYAPADEVFMSGLVLGRGSFSLAWNAILNWDGLR